MGFRPGESGNPKGKPKGTRNRETKLFIEAKETVEKAKALSLYEHAIEQAFKDNTVLIQIIKKFVPDKIGMELTGADGDPIEVRHSLDEQKKRIREYLDSQGIKVIEVKKEKKP